MVEPYIVTAGSDGPEIQISGADLAPHGYAGRLAFTIAPREAAAESRNPFDDETPREFHAKALLASFLSLDDSIGGKIDADSGSSLFILPEHFRKLDVVSMGFSFVCYKNKEEELSFIETKFQAKTLAEARQTALLAINHFLDHISFVGDLPVFVSKFLIQDRNNNAHSFDYVAPYIPLGLGNFSAALPPELMPFYALYREAKNSNSPFYRLLCYCKIIEGVRLQKAEVRQKAKKLAITLPIFEDCVPNEKKLVSYLLPYVGKSIESFYDEVVKKSHRDAIAHFQLNSTGVPIYMSFPIAHEHFSHIAFAAEICSRTMLNNLRLCIEFIVAAGGSQA